MTTVLCYFVGTRVSVELRVFRSTQISVYLCFERTRDLGVFSRKQVDFFFLFEDPEGFFSSEGVKVT